MDMNTGQWSDNIIDAFDLPRDILPEVVHPATAIGNIKQDIANEIECDPIPLMAVGCHDTASAVAAVPAAGKKNWAYLSSGTWSLMGIELDKSVINDDSFEYEFTNWHKMPRLLPHISMLTGSSF
jgi:rhamnulokinase